MSCAGAGAGAGAGASAVQVQLQVMCGACACTICRFFHLSIATFVRVVFCLTVFVYIFKSLNNIFFFTISWLRLFCDWLGNTLIHNLRYLK